MDIDNFQYVLGNIINKYASDYRYSASGITIDCAFSDCPEDNETRRLIVQMTDGERYELLFKKES